MRVNGPLVLFRPAIASGSASPACYCRRHCIAAGAALVVQFIGFSCFGTHSPGDLHEGSSHRDLNTACAIRQRRRE